METYGAAGALVQMEGFPAFPNSKIKSDGGMIVEFELDGINFIALNGGSQFKFNEASLSDSCKKLINE